MKYFRCHFISEGIQCELWPKLNEALPHDNPENMYCPSHRNSPVVSVNKSAYVERRNETARQCYEMALDELDSHIAGLEKKLEEARADVWTARGVRADRLNKLSDEERAARRKIRVEKVDKAPKRESLDSLMKRDPVAYLMKKYNMSREKAELMWKGDD